jgi:drug/metabolite transporter (DMT)-like permease
MGRLPRPSDWLLLVAMAWCFSGAFAFNAVALADLPPLTIVLARVALGALALQLVLRLRGERVPVGWRRRCAFLALGALGSALPLTLTVAGQTRIGGGQAAILVAMTPLCTLVAARLLTRDEPLSANRLAGVLLGVAGAVVVIGPSSVPGLGGDRGELAGQLAVLGAAVAYALAAVYGRRFRDLPPLTTAAGQLSGATVWLLPLALVVDRPWAWGMPGPAAIGAVTGLALLCTALAYVLYFRLLPAVGPTNLSLATFLVPVGALLLGAALLGEPIEPRQILGMAVVFLGLAGVDGRLPAVATRRLRHRVVHARSAA